MDRLWVFSRFFLCFTCVPVTRYKLFLASGQENKYKMNTSSGWAIVKWSRKIINKLCGDRQVTRIGQIYAASGQVWNEFISSPESRISGVACPVRKSKNNHIIDSLGNLVKLPLCIYPNIGGAYRLLVCRSRSPSAWGS